MNIKPLVAIHCFVYNHEPYLRDCFEGFVMQQTNFPFVAIVHDDASTDGSTAIIREYEEKYPHIFKPIYETENQYSKHDGSIDRIMNKSIDAFCPKYVAMCEGDDYWIDPQKLQKQVDYFENNIDCGLVCGKAMVFHQQKNVFVDNKGELEDSRFENLYQGYDDLITPTVMMKYSLYKQCIQELSPLMSLNLFFDTAIWYWFSLKSNIYVLDSILAVYRVLPNSACHSTTDSKIIELNYKYLNLKIAFMSILNDFHDDRLGFMMCEIMKMQNEISKYAQEMAKQSVRQSVRYRIGNKILHLLRGKQ